MHLSDQLKAKLRQLSIMVSVYNQQLRDCAGYEETGRAIEQLCASWGVLGFFKRVKAICADQVRELNRILIECLLRDHTQVTNRFHIDPRGDQDDLHSRTSLDQQTAATA